MMIYYGDIPTCLTLNRLHRPDRLAHVHKLERFFVDVAGPESLFPQYCFIEPNYVVNAMDYHPVNDNEARSEKFIADVYNALVRNPALFAKTLLVITFDEHGGFYDHMVPPTTVAPDDLRPKDADPESDFTFQFDRLGFRVPALLISPWLRRGVDDTIYDHTSLLKHLTAKWGLGPLGRRTEVANDPGNNNLWTTEPRTDVREIDLTALATWQQTLIPTPKTDFIEILNEITAYLDRSTDNKGLDRLNAVVTDLVRLRDSLRQKRQNLCDKIRNLFRC